MTTALLDTDGTDLRDLSDDALMQRLNEGLVESSLSELKRRWGRTVHSFVKSIVRDHWLADDVSQDVLAKVFFKSHLYQPGTNFQAWLFEVARNQALSAVRARRRTPIPVGSLSAMDGSDDDPLESLPGTDDRRLEEEELMGAFHEAVAKLPQRYREVFEMCVQQGVQYQEAARRLGIPTGTVAIRIMRARRRLFEEVSRHVGRLRRPPACFQ